MNEQLFSSPVSVCMKCAGHEDRIASVRIHLELRISTAALQRKELNIRLTDDSDPFFLFNLALGEEDFQTLKVQQGLLVDFTAFPQKLIELLQRCAEEQSREYPKFILQLVRSEPLSHGLAELCIVETNPFKHLTHLALKLQPGNDVDVKKYLASCLKHLQNEHTNLTQRLKITESSLSGQLQETEKALSTRTRELESLRSEWTAHTQSLVAKHKQELAEYKQNTLQDQRDIEQRYEKEKKELEDLRRQGSSELQCRLEDLLSSNKDLTETKYRLESSVRDLKGRLRTLDEDYQHAQHDLQALRQQRGSLESDQRSREQTMSQQQTRLAVLQQELRDKEALLAKSNQLMEAANQQRDKLEESMQHKTSLVTKLESTVKSTSQEVMKGNEIIKKLQGELKAALTKLKLKNTVTGKQEKLLEEKGQTLRAVQQDFDAAKSKNQELERENERLKESSESVRGKLEESRQLLKTNENVINWLNKQVNEAHMAKRHGLFEVPTSTVAYRPQMGAPAVAPPIHSRPTSVTHLTNTMSTIHQSTPMGYNSYTGNMTGASKRSEPVLDPKYLRPNSHITTVSADRGVGLPQKTGPVIPPQLSSTPLGGTTPPSVSGAPPLMSAYFPPQLQGAT